MPRRIVLLIFVLLSAFANAQERIRDVIYMKQAGAAFTMDVFKPKISNGAAIIYLVSGGWFSSHDNINPQLAEGLNAEGFTVFEVVHGAQPRYKIQEISKMITRAVRFVRFYVLKLGFLDGAAGFAHIAIGAFASFLKHAKLRALERADRSAAQVETRERSRG